MGDLELQRLKAVADAARAMRMAASITSYYGIEADHSDSGYIVNISVLAWKALVDALNVLDKGREIPEQGYDDGPWASTGSDSCVDVTGHWCFPGPDVKFKVSPPIVVKPLQQGGFVVDDQRGFTDALDMAEWLLGWLGVDDEPVGSADATIETYADEMERLWPMINEQLTDYHKRARAFRGVLDVAEAARVYVEHSEGDDIFEDNSDRYRELIEAMNKWRPMCSRGASAIQVVKTLDVVAAVLAYVNYVETGSGPKWVQGALDKLAEAVKKWRGIEGEWHERGAACSVQS